MPCHLVTCAFWTDFYTILHAIYLKSAGPIIHCRLGIYSFLSGGILSLEVLLTRTVKVMILLDGSIEAKSRPQRTIQF